MVGWRIEKTHEEEGQMGLERVLEWAFLGEGQGVKSGIGRNGDKEIYTLKVKLSLMVITLILPLITPHLCGL